MIIFFENRSKSGAEGASANDRYFHKTILAQELYVIIEIRFSKGEKMLKVYYGDCGERDGHEFAWDMLRKILKDDFKISFTDEDIVYNEHKKPFLRGNPVFFNISHYGRLCAVAVSDSEVGVQVEHKDNFKAGANVENSHLWLSDKEQKELLKSEDFAGYLTERWTEKKAILKMIGSGLLNVQSLKNAFRHSKYNVSTFFIGNHCLSVTNRDGDELKMRNLIRF